MYGFDWSNKQKSVVNGNYEIKPKVISNISPLMWAENCVECAMPACYGNYSHYLKRMDGRCLLFQNGIEIVDKPGLFGYSVKIKMRPWAKLETFLFGKSYSFNLVRKMDNLYRIFTEFSKSFGLVSVRRLNYFAKEYFTRKIGFKQGRLPQYFVVDIFNENSPFSMILENRTNGQTIYRNNLKLDTGRNVFILDSNDFKYNNSVVNNLCLYPENNNGCELIISALDFVTFSDEFKSTTFFKRHFVQNPNKVKCVVWDLDNTLWDGFLSENDNVILKEKVVKIIKSLDEKGILNSISSKNDYELAYKKLVQFEIDQYFLCPQINWYPKSQGIKTIAKRLNIGLDTFVFIDDTENELNEVFTNCNGIRVCNVNCIDEYLQNKIFDVPVTKESQRRRFSYIENLKREQEQSSFNGDFEEFIKNCNIVVDISKPIDEELERCHELIQRTNQLNISGERLIKDEFLTMVNNSAYDCLRINVKDKFGNYGLVGVLIMDITDMKNLFLRHFVFSCRAARKKIEEALFLYLVSKYRNKGYDILSIKVKKTVKNLLMQQVLEEIGIFTKNIIDKDSYLLICDLNTVNKLSTLMKIQDSCE